MALIEHDQPDVVDQRRVIAQCEVEFFRGGDDDIHRPQGILITR